MAVVVTAASGFDVEYVLAGVTREPEKSAGGYYMNAAQQGEAPGRWFGKGAEQLGLGGQVDPDHYRAVYGDRQADPRTGEPLGAPKRQFSASFEARLAGLLAAEPEATAERRHELEKQARKDTRTAPAYTDITVSFSKSISILHGSIRENARRAREAGDTAAAAWWDDRERRFSEILQDANRAALEHAQKWAGVTRTGYHGRKVNGQETGKWEDADLVVTSWLQGTSRDGEMQDHVHNPFLPKVRTTRDGKWRALDTMALRGQLPAMQAVAAAHAEAALSREFGVQWVARPDGAGFEIRGIAQAQMDEFSSRRAAISERKALLADDFRRKYGRDPNQREMSEIDNAAWYLTRKSKDDAEYLAGECEDARIDWDRAAQLWDARLGGKLADIARAVTTMRGPGRADARAARGVEFAPDFARRAAREALARVQAKHATWTRADLMRQVAVSLEPQARPADPAAAVALIEALTDQAIASLYEPVQEVTNPDWPVLPDHLRREVDGRSVYTRPGSARYATRVQLSMEERLLAHARRETSARMTREDAAREFGADLDALDAALVERAALGRDAQVTGSGLRVDQAAAITYLLTSPRVCEVLVGPAGAGKTWVLAEGARAWKAATGGRVIGLATSQAARNVLAAAGVELAQNTAQFLGHLPGQRGALGIRDVGPGTLILLDESSMTSTPDLHDIAQYAASMDCKMITAGDQEQLASVEGGGGMNLLARRLGYVQLAEAVRFDAGWERDASLGLRRGDLAALDEYDQHGRITGAEPEQALDDAARTYVSHYLAGTDVLLIARSRETCRELSRRVRDDLIHLGRVGGGEHVTLAKGAEASAGDVIVARQNDHELEAGEEDRSLANGDVMRIEAVNGDGSLTVRRRTDRDPQTGQQRWTEATFRFDDLHHADLGYAVTGHSAQGLTVSAGLPVVTGSESRQWFYSAMTRGAQMNQAFTFTQPQAPADPREGTRAAPELKRSRRLRRERAGQATEPQQAPGRPDPREPYAVLADVLGRDEAQESALETWRRELADADHLGKLAAIWDGETAEARQIRYKAAVTAAVPDEWRGARLARGQATWLWRTLRAAEAAGHDVDQVVTAAVRERTLDGVRDLASVLDARIRTRLGDAAPADLRPWSERVPETGDPDRDTFLRELAAAMDDRKERLGEFTAQYSPAWAVNALGPVPEDPLDNRTWEVRASHIAAYREQFGYEHETDPVGPEPVNSPEARASWWAARSGITRTDEADLSAEPDSRLWLMRATYAAETAWAPAYVGDELRQVRLAGLKASADAARAAAEAEVARREGDAGRAARHEHLAASAKAARDFYAERAGLDEQQMQDRRDWSDRTDGARQLAVKADAELRRRNPEEYIEPLASAEPDPVPDELPPVLGAEDRTRHAEAVAAKREAFRQQLEERLGVMVPAEDPDLEDEGEAWPPGAVVTGTRSCSRPSRRCARLSGPPSMWLNRRRGKCRRPGAHCGLTLRVVETHDRRMHVRSELDAGRAGQVRRSRLHLVRPPLDPERQAARARRRRRPPVRRVPRPRRRGRPGPAPRREDRPHLPR